MGQSIIKPIIYAFLIAVLLRPIVLFFKVKLRFPHIIAVIVSVVFFIAFILSIFIFMSFQISDVISDFDKIGKNLNIHINNIQIYIRETFNISSKDQNIYINEITGDSMETGKEIIGLTFISFTDSLLSLILVPIYTFLILLYRTHLLVFLSKLFKKENQTKLTEILGLIKVVVKSYILGLIFEMLIVSVLTSVGLMIIGVKYAILLGIITGLLNLIPYIGILFAGVLTIIVSLSGSAELSMIFGVLIVNIVVQFIDNNILVPMVVSSKVEVNAFISIIGIIIGGAIAGISGMFLAIPIIAILKVIFDRIEALEPWGYLMGDDLPKTYQWKSIKLPLYDFENASDTTPVNNQYNTTIIKSSESEN